MFRLVLVKTKTLLLCLLLVWLQSSSTLRLKSGKPSMYMKKHKGYHRSHVSDSQASSQASRRSTYRINMPMRVAKLLLPQIGNKNQETIIRIYPDKTAEQNQQNQNGSNYVLSLSYKKLNEEGPNNAAFKDPCPQGGCCCCSGMNIDPMSICRPGCPICPTPCVCCCCSPPPPPPPPPPPKKPPPPTCPMVCLPCCPCPRPPCPCRPHCIRRPILRPCYPPCRIPAPPLTGPIPGPCVPAPPVMGPCHPPCLPRLPPIRPLPQLQRFAPNPLAAAPPISPNRPIVVDHPLRGPAIFIDQCRDFIAECKDYAKRGMCNHPSPFHTIQQIRKICPFSCGICKDYDENAALLRRHTQKQSKHVTPALRAKLNIALAQIIRNKALEGHSTIEPEQEKPVSKDEQTGEKKSHDTIASESQPHNSQVLPGGEEDFSGSGRSGYITNEIA